MDRVQLILMRVVLVLMPVSFTMALIQNDAAWLFPLLLVIFIVAVIELRDF